jgi:hypothetical protein
MSKMSQIGRVNLSGIGGIEIACDEQDFMLSSHETHRSGTGRATLALRKSALQQIRYIPQIGPVVVLNKRVEILNLFEECRV